MTARKLLCYSGCLGAFALTASGGGIGATMANDPALPGFSFDWGGYRAPLFSGKPDDKPAKTPDELAKLDEKAGYTPAQIIAGSTPASPDPNDPQKKGMNNKRVLDETKIKGHKTSMDLERGGSGNTNIHLKVDGTKYIYNSTTGKFVSTSGSTPPNSVVGNNAVQQALMKALDLIIHGW